MSKVLLKVTVNNLTHELKGILNKKENIITYSDAENIINKIYLNNNVLVRNSSVQNILIDFNKKEILYHSIDGTEISIPISIINLVKDEYSFSVTYYINECEVFDYKISIYEKSKKNIAFV